MAASLYAFVLIMMSFELRALGNSFNPGLPVRFIAGWQLFSALGLAVRWLADLIPALMSGNVPAALDHYANIPVYSMDLGLVVPTFLVAAVLIAKGKPFGYLLSAVMFIKGCMMWIALAAMTLASYLVGTKMGFMDLAMAPVFGLITIYCFTRLLVNVNEENYSSNISIIP